MRGMGGAVPRARRESLSGVSALWRSDE